MTKIKVAHILHSVGGVDVALRLILENIDNKKFETIIIHGIQDTVKPFTDTENKPVKSYKIPIFREINIFRDISAIYQAYKIIKREKPDIIHAHSAKGGVVGRIAGILTGIPSLYTPHAFSYLSTKSALMRKAYIFIERLFLNSRSSNILATSESERSRAIDELGFNPQKVLLYNNCIAPIKEIKTLSIEKTWPDKYICTVGRPSYQKNTELLVKVVHEIKKTREVHLVLMGVGYYLSGLDIVAQLIKDLDLNENITMLPWTSRDDVFNIISNSQMYISTSRYEGMPYSVIESMALGKACVVSNCDGNRDLIVDGYNGFVIEGEDIRGFKDRTTELLDNNSLREMFSSNAKQLFEQKFNVLKNIKELESIYAAYCRAQS